MIDGVSLSCLKTTIEIGTSCYLRKKNWKIGHSNAADHAPYGARLDRLTRMRFVSGRILEGFPQRDMANLSFDSIIKNGYNGCIIDWKNSDNVSRAITNCLEDTSIGTYARHTITENFSQHAVAKKLNRAYDEFK
jgi:hypothetical protein